MKSDLDIIKKRYGEKLAHFFSDNCPDIVNKPGALLSIMEKNFPPSRLLQKDVEENSKSFIKFIYSEYARTFQPTKPIENENSTMHPAEVLKKHGYTLHHCTTKEDVESFKKYYADINSSLCTFSDIDGRLASHDIFFIVKEGAIDMRMPDPRQGSLEDEYSTSVLCFQFRKGPHNNPKCISRYNRWACLIPEARNNPNAVFDCNPDNFIEGLYRSFENAYGYDLSPAESTNPFACNYIKANDGKYYKFNSTCDGVVFCANNIVIENGEPVQYDKGRYVVLDSCILDKQAKKFIFPDSISKESQDGLASTYQDIETIDVVNGENNSHVISLTDSKGHTSFITIDDHSRIVEYENEHLATMPDNFLHKSDKLSKINTPGITTMGNNCLPINQVREFVAPNLISMGNNCLATTENLTSFSADLLITIGDDCLTTNALTKFVTPSLENMGKYCLCNCYSLNQVITQSLKTMDEGCLANTYMLQELIAPALASIGDNCITSPSSLTNANLDSVAALGANSLSNLDPNEPLSKLLRSKGLIQQSMNNNFSPFGLTEPTPLGKESSSNSTASQNQNNPSTAPHMNFGDWGAFDAHHREDHEM